MKLYKLYFDHKLVRSFASYEPLKTLALQMLAEKSGDAEIFICRNEKTHLKFKGCS